MTLGRVAGRAAGEVATVLAIRMSVALLGAIAALAGVWVLYRQSMRPSQWGPYLPGEPAVTIERYSTPWLIGATVLALVAGLLVVAAVADFVRWRRVRRAARRERS